MAPQMDNVNFPMVDGALTDNSNIATKSPDPYTAKQKPFETYIHQSPVTVERKPYLPPPISHFKEAGTARANIAPSQERPDGTTEAHWAAEHRHQTVVQQHVEYWDDDHDGIIWPQDTYRGCRNFGWSPPLAFLTAFIINFNLSYPTVPGYLPDPFFRIWLDRLYKDKHGSDSMTYDNEGRFKPQNFEDIFAKYDRGDKGGLDISDTWRFLKGQRMVFDFFGWSAALLEWTATYLVIWPEDGIMRKEDIRGVFDGSIFYRKAEQHHMKQKRKQQERLAISPRLVSLAKKLC